MRCLQEHPTQENMAGVLLEQNVLNEIKTRFYKIKNVNEFASLLNFIETNIYDPKEEILPITFSHLYFLSKSKDNRYTTFFIQKKSGKLRELNSPDKLLKRIQKVINILLQIIFEEHSHHCSNGFIKGKDIKRNALPHVNKKFVLNIDIDNFFPSINFRRIKVVLELSPFNLFNEREKIAFIIANLSTYKGYLPQGACTSPILSNIVTQKLDRELSKFCNPTKIKYSRYADDLTFSSNQEFFNDEFYNRINSIINEQNFLINCDKTRLRNNRESQQVTGLIVNNKVNVKREYLQKVRAMLNNWEKGGLQYAEKEFKKHQPNGKENYNFKSVLGGHLSFLKLIKGENHEVVTKLRLKYLYLENLIDYSKISNKDLQLKLKEDNIHMENLFFNNNNSEYKFISFCTSAFHQIENLLNYYYWRKFPFLDDLFIELINQNPLFKQQYKTLEKCQQKFSDISKININVLVYLYEKETFFDKSISYNKHLTMLREIRNDDSHRCSIIEIDKNKIETDYQIILAKKKKSKVYQLTPHEQKIELNYQTLLFLKQKNFNQVRENVRAVAKNIQNYFVE